MTRTVTVALAALLVTVCSAAQLHRTSALAHQDRCCTAQVPHGSTVTEVAGGRGGVAVWVPGASDWVVLGRCDDIAELPPHGARELTWMHCSPAIAARHATRTAHAAAYTTGTSVPDALQGGIVTISTLLNGSYTDVQVTGSSFTPHEPPSDRRGDHQLLHTYLTIAPDDGSGGNLEAVMQWGQYGDVPRIAGWHIRSWYWSRAGPSVTSTAVPLPAITATGISSTAGPPPADVAAALRRGTNKGLDLDLGLGADVGAGDSHFYQATIYDRDDDTLNATLNLFTTAAPAAVKVHFEANNLTSCADLPAAGTDGSSTLYITYQTVEVVGGHTAGSGGVLQNLDWRQDPDMLPFCDTSVSYAPGEEGYFGSVTFKSDLKG